MNATMVSYKAYALARDSRKMTDHAVAIKAGIRPSTISDWKMGRYTPKIDKIAAIARALDVPIEALLSA